MKAAWIQRRKYSWWGRFATLPIRLRVGLAPLIHQAGQTALWLLRSREWATFSYDYEPEGVQALAAAIGVLLDRKPAEIRALADELLTDEVFATRYALRVTQSRLRYTCDPTLHYGRWLANYMLVRATGATVVFEAGTDRGLSAWAICRALHRNGGAGALLITVDINVDRGEFLEGDEGGLVRRLVGDSVQVLTTTSEKIDLFIHDTVNEPVHTRSQFTALREKLAPGAMVHTSWFGGEFVEFCEHSPMRYLEYVERVRGHWYAGRRTGLAVYKL